ncbi:hypothetical protein ACFL5O_07175 [Myxococcota bacterium]
MKPVRVYLAHAQVKQLEALAPSRGWTQSKAIRAAVAALTRPDRAILSDDRHLETAGFTRWQRPAGCGCPADDRRSAQPVTASHRKHAVPLAVADGHVVAPLPTSPPDRPTL